MIDASIPSIPVAGALDGFMQISNHPTDQVALNSAQSQLFSSMLSDPSASGGKASDSDDEEE
ncbi:MAG: hypothetical protein JF606_19705 [Burkholderiales bacterium]|jgi:hypothetical protein|nr:hypothetical protein [Burkholderiales bacterium]